MDRTILLRKRKTKDPCTRCQMHMTLCICKNIPNLNLKTKVTLVVHAKELKRTTNTGSLALQALVNSAIYIRGVGREPLDLSAALLPEYDSVLFYPSDDAIELSQYVQFERSKPIQLIVPDGNWRQASKVSIRHPELKALPRVKITASNTASQHLRKEHFAEGMSTLEAIAAALAEIEGRPTVEPLFQLYQAKLQATLRGRGVFEPGEDSSSI